jgi:hypothetical protein
MHTIRKLARVMLVLVPLACGGGDEEAAQAAPEVPAAAAGDSAGTASGCPETGPWQQCSVEKRIERAGLVATALPDTARKDFMAVPGLRYDLGRGELQLYLYADSVARKRDTDRLDPERAAPPGQGGGWSTRARLITSNNMAAVLLTTNETLAERVALALGAGMPR